MKAGRAGRLALLLAVVIAGCYTGKLDVVELTPRGPSAEEQLTLRSLAINGRTPSFEERRQWQGQVEDRVFAYLREHPEIEQSARYTDFRFWWQVTTGSTPREVRVLLQEPQEQTIDPARMAALAERHWSEVRDKAKEAWVYEPAWVLYFDDKAVIGIVHRISSSAPSE
jgi:hypothetical protein